VAKDLDKNLDIWKDRTLFDVTEESNLRIIVSPHQKRKKKLQGSLEKHNEHKNVLNDFSKILLHCLMWKMVPQVEDDLTNQMLEIKPTEKGSKHVFICIMKRIGCHGIEGHQKIAWHMFNWITNFEHELLRKFLARPEPCAGNCRSWMMGTWVGLKDLQYSERREEKKKRWQRKRRKVGQRKWWNTEDGVILRGEGCNVPLKMPLNILWILNVFVL